MATAAHLAAAARAANKERDKTGDADGSREHVDEDGHGGALSLD